jgi:cellulose synthase/poly-beta-1,6-N-acetylglucosamine synthase-like glycosyltransferase
MLSLISWILLVLTGLLGTPVAIFCLEIISAILLLRRRLTAQPIHGSHPRIAVLVPAHNESKGLLPTLSDLGMQMRPGDKLLVVADNCTDDTAQVALNSGAEVIERCDPTQVGKGYALDFGIRHLSVDPPDIVVMIDADCRLAPDAIGRLVTTCAATSRPVQGLYLMTTPIGSLINHQVAEFAWRIKNWLRPLGLSALGMPCQLMGTGMAIPWDVVRLSDLAHGWIVEDLKLGLDLAVAGYPPLFCPSACVTSQFASSDTGVRVQRTRWEQGHIRTILTLVPRLFAQAMTHRDWALLALTLDLAVPPLSLLIMLMVGMFVVSLLAALFGLSILPLIISTVSFLLLLLAIGLAWHKIGRDIVPGRAFPLMAQYVFRKIGFYCHIMFSRMDTKWVRTDRKETKRES